MPARLVPLDGPQARCARPHSLLAVPSLTSAPALAPTEHIDWISADLAAVLGAAPAHLALDLRVHITDAPEDVATLSSAPEKSPAESGESLSLDSASGAGASKTQIAEVLDGVAVCRGRPEIATILAEEAAAAIGSMSVDGELVAYLL